MYVQGTYEYMLLIFQQRQRMEEKWGFYFQNFFQPFSAWILFTIFNIASSAAP